ncbi:hypothetical protein [Nocardia testacea]|uniref:hypothetical protein n=1 Tax=Nocardia testacea TaxID=248551 RepID=UPI003A8381DE
MIILGVDPHKASHTATVVDTPATTTIDTLTISSSETEYRRPLGAGHGGGRSVTGPSKTPMGLVITWRSG